MNWAPGGLNRAGFAECSRYGEVESLGIGETPLDFRPLLLPSLTPLPVSARGRTILAGEPAGVSVVTPTLRESECLPALAERVAAVLSASGLEWELIVADDDSRDGTEAVAAKLARSLPVRLHVRRGPRPDLSEAVLDGIGIARFDRVVVLDADLSHPPETIPLLLRELRPGCDIAVGSRYAAGGGVTGPWSRYRNLNSRAATLLARPLARLSDPMSGFFAVDRRRLPCRERLHPLGFKIGLELIVRGRLRAREVPISFGPRRHGRSKLNWRRQVEFLRHLHRLYGFRFGLPVRIASFGAVGLSGLVIDTAVYLGLQWAGAGHLLARFLSFWPAVTWNWRLNRGLTFGDRPRGARFDQWRRFAAASVAGLAANFGGYAALTAWVDLFARHRLAALLAGVAMGSALNFALAARFVYRP